VKTKKEPQNYYFDNFSLWTQKKKTKLWEGLFWGELGLYCLKKTCIILRLEIKLNKNKTERKCLRELINLRDPYAFGVSKPHMKTIFSFLPKMQHVQMFFNAEQETALLY